MAYHIYGNNNSGNRQSSSAIMSTSDHITQDSYDYDYELKRLMDREHQLRVTQQQLPIDNNVIGRQNTSYIPLDDGMYRYTQQHLTNSPIDQLLLPTTSTTTTMESSWPANPLRIIIIRHAERADAVLGSDWSRKCFDRNGRYRRHTEHLPDALPHRSYLHHYVIDVPLTNRGRMHSFKTGRSLLFNGYGADFCYTSPSLRCVQSANGILTGMGRRDLPMQVEPGLFECYLNDFKRTLCFMTKDELIANGYNIDRSYQPLVPFMRPHDSQTDYYERSRVLIDQIIERHQATGGNILIVAHAPSLEGLTRHLSGGEFKPEKLFEIARRVPFLAMTIIEKNGINNPWLFRTRPLQSNPTQTIHELPFDSLSSSTRLDMVDTNHLMTQQGRLQQQQQQQQQQQSTQIQTIGNYAQPNHPLIENLQSESPTSLLPIDIKKLVKSATAPNLRMSSSRSEMFRVI